MTTTDEPRLHELAHPPAAALFMTRAMLTRRRPTALPRMVLRLAPARAPADGLAAFRRLTGQPDGDALPLLWPQVWGFRLQMALLTDPAFPLPIWNALQVRNRLRQHAVLPVDGRYALAVQAQGVRPLDKGVEVDLGTTLHDTHGLPVWESITTFYWRGQQRITGAAAPPPRTSPAVDAPVVCEWSSGEGSGWRFGGLTGDYNGVHMSDTYARAFGFARAFHHPPRIAGQCLARLDPARHTPQQDLELWLKGPVYYRSALALRRTVDREAHLFTLHVDGDARAALVGRWMPAPRGSLLGDGAA